MGRLAIAGLMMMAALAATTSNSFAQGGSSVGPRQMRTPPPPTPEALAKTVGLTDDQLAKVKDIQAARAAAMADVQAAIKANTQDISDAMKAGDTDKQNEALVQFQKLNLQSQAISQKFDDQQMAVLTDDQKAKLKEANDAAAIQQATKYYTLMYQEQAKVCDLSDDQVKAMVAIDLAQNAAALQWQKENQEKLAAIQTEIQEAKKSGDTEKVKELEAQSNELYAPLVALGAKREADAFAVMTDAQKAKWIEHKTVQNALQQFNAFNLTDDQKAKLKDLCHTLAQEKGATVASIWAKLQQEMFGSILTNDQKAGWLQFQTLQYVNMNYYMAKLTDEQKAKIKENYTTLAANNGTPDAAMLKDLASMIAAVPEIYKKLSPQIDAMLSNEQKAALAKGMKGFTGLNPTPASIAPAAPGAPTITPRSR